MATQESLFAGQKFIKGKVHKCVRKFDQQMQLGQDHFKIHENLDNSGIHATRQQRLNKIKSKT